MSRGYAWFTAGIGAWALAAGMQQVLFAWLLVGELQVTPRWVGIAQMCQMLPSLLFLLFGGVVADRLDRRRLLIGLHVTGALTLALIAAAVAADRLSVGALIVYALCWGTIQAFASPARDALLSDVAGPDLMRAVTGATLALFAGLGLGNRLAGAAQALGSASALAIDATLLIVGAFTLLRLPVAAVTFNPTPSRPLAALREGLAEVRQSDRLRPVALLVAANGLFFMGPYLVLCPLLVRNLYNGGVDDLAFSMTSLTAGTIVGSLVNLWRGGVRSKGRAFLLALMAVALCLLAIAVGPAYQVFVALLFVWGIGHAFFLNTSRTLFQETATASHRARVLSVHSLGLLGMAPLSQIAAGVVATRVGPLAGCGLAGGAMVVIAALAWRFTSIRRLD